MSFFGQKHPRLILKFLRHITTTGFGSARMKHNSAPKSQYRCYAEYATMQVSGTPAGTVQYNNTAKFANKIQ